MPHTFGEKDPGIKDELAARMFSFFDSKTLAVNAQLVSKDWKRIVNRPELKEVKELCKCRVIIDNKIFRHCPALQNETADSMAMTRLSGGWTNATFIAKNPSHKYVVRLAGNKTDVLIDRKSEAYNARIVSECGVNPGVVYSDAKSGAQVTEFIENPITMKPEDFKDFENIKRVMKPLKMIHESGKKFMNTTDIFARNKSVQEWLLSKGVCLPEEYQFAAQKMQELEKLIIPLNIKKVPCHNDTTTPNFIYSGDKSDFMYVIDWEYSGNNDPMWDVVNFSMEANLTPEAEAYMLSVYYGDQDYSLERIRFQLYKPIVEYWTGLWTQVQLVNENHVAGLDTLVKFERVRMENCKKLFESAEYANAIEQLKGMEVSSNSRCIPCMCL